ncbi:serine/threonine-protein kinase PLK1-like [Chelonus insularis]|uniref:serine/threonine-protein kinase PLK1-like n=1 Tax=Chelonus insularis TaxID=460826 RepID=UPI00158D0285|nr:serine/threonine-protein kinase PLK1-like [Chelonus insularis]
MSQELKAFNGFLNDSNKSSKKELQLIGIAKKYQLNIHENITESSINYLNYSNNERIKVDETMNSNKLNSISKFRAQEIDIINGINTNVPTMIISTTTESTIDVLSGFVNNHSTSSLSETNFKSSTMNQVHQSHGKNNNNNSATTTFLTINSNNNNNNIKVPIIDMKKINYSCSLYTSTIRSPQAPGKVVTTSSLPTSLTDLPVNHESRKTRSEPGSLSSVTVKNPMTINSTPGRISTAARISSLDGLDSLGVNNNNNNNINNNGPRVSVSSAIATSVSNNNAIIHGNKSMWDNNSMENESDYVVDPVQGNAYHKGQFLGKGGFAKVYLMTDLANGKKYACKIIPKNRMQKIHIQKIAREIMIHKDLNHINVVQMHHYFEDNLNVYMLLEACPRKSLMHVLKYRGKVTEPEARYYMKQMVTGVAYIHSQKVVHRDLKPGNMFLSDGMIVKIGDFGLATRPDGQRRRVTVCGTPNYIAPEVLYKQSYSFEADVWALGCILYALLAGQPPFEAATLKETYSKICNNRYKKLDDTVASRSGQDLIRCLLHPLPELRPSLARVKEHPYLTVEYVPERLAHSCCYRVPTLQNSLTDSNVKSTFTPPTLSVPSATSLSSASSMTSTTRSKPRPILQESQTLSRIAEVSKPKTIAAITTMKPISATQSVKESKQKSKVGHWLVKRFPKLTKLRQQFGTFFCPDRKKSSESAMMHRALETCLSEVRFNRTTQNPLAIDGIVPLFITKWIDYSNKYGLCFQLSDRSVGVLFNDSTKMSYTRDRRRVEYTSPDDEIIRYSRERDVPSFMQEKLELLRHFTEYMDDHLTNGGEIGQYDTTKLSKKNSGNVPRMRRWLRTDKAIVMELTVPLLQVNFFADHTKIVVSEGTRARDYLVTYIDANRHATSYWLNDLRDFGCTTELYERLDYVCKASREFAHLEHNAACSEISINCGTTLRA